MRQALPLLASLLTVVGFASQNQGQTHPAGERLGTVHFETSCRSAAQPGFDRAVSLLHSFEFGPAIAAFEATLRQDPSCAMAEWGIALSDWGNPFGLTTRSAGQLRTGLSAIERARAIGAGTAREKAYIAAAAHLYSDPAQPQQARLAAYRDAMGTVSKQHPKDTEAAIFYALSLTAAEDVNDKTYSGRLQAVAILEPLFARQPNHPGLAHYIIHSYDVPALAPRALDAAMRYAAIAPSAPHALHMPSHTFTRVGLWQQSIDTNIASAAAAKAGGATAEELHASDYQMYAYLQTAQDTAARRLLDSLPDMVARFGAGSVASAAPPSAARYATAAIPARWVLERGAWSEAATLDLRPTDVPYADALTAFARVVGAARSGDAAGARAALAVLDAVRDRQAATKEAYWVQQIDIERQSAAAWVAFAEGHTSDAIARMRAAADSEDKTEKAAVTPGPLAPAREQLAEMLFEAKDPVGALEQFQATLVKEPNRFRSMSGAGRAAAASGDADTARRYFGQLVKMCERADSPGRPELQEARAAVAPRESGRRQQETNR
jgi:hypothetical protein